MGILELIQQKAFLGREWMTWLWHRAETHPVFELPGGKTCEIEIDGPLLLDAHYGDARQSALRGQSPGTAPEAATALLEGKKLKRARLKIMCDGVDWIATLDGENMNVSGLNLPKSGQLPFEEALRLRHDFAMEFEAMLSALFEEFLELRLDETAWAEELKKIQDWVLQK